MGNNNSIYPTDKYIESIECSICLENHYKYIKLKCGHKFDYYCIQMHLYTKFLEKSNLDCPFCRTPICNKNLNDIWSKWIIINYKNDIFSTNTILNINNKLKLNKLNEIEYNTDMNINTILMPLYNGKPAFLLSPIINDSIVLYNDKVIELSHLLANYQSEYGETINKYNFIMDSYITDKKWKKFLLKISKLFNFNNSYNYDYDFNEKFLYSEYKIRFYINDINNIKTIDNYNGTYYDNLHYFKNRKFKCVFKMYFIRNDYDLFLINELHSIIY